MAICMHDVIMTRSHRILAARAEQLALNFLALRGGRPYVDARLWRAPNESDLSWTGRGAVSSATATVGRRQRACLVNDAGRVAQKINQYLFSQDVARVGMDEGWARDVTGTGRSIRAFWQDASDAMTAGQWAWIQVDRGAPSIDPETGKPKQRSLRDREVVGDRVRWILWPSTAVQDWSYAPDGSLSWLLTEEETYSNADPTTEAQATKTRTLWRRDAGGATWDRYECSQDGKVTVVGNGSISCQDVPFVLLGSPSVDPWWFDDVEMIQAQVMNLDSLHVENLVRTVFGQLVIPATALSSLEARLVERYGANNGERIVEVVREIVRGLDSPMVESAEESGITRFIQPSASDLKALPDELSRKRQLLFDMVGLALFNKETRQVQTAESKQFDHLDTEATLIHRATALQEAETRVVSLSARIDPEFKVYAPEWPMKFDVVDVQNDARALVEVGNVPGLTLTQRKVLLRSATRVMGQLTRIDPADARAIDEEIDALEDEAFVPPGAGPTRDGDFDE